mmetsp:Transcript_61642/g.132520  ORF Transcript_61642/g.132520 Transcript_61642/m.132520 type:complete len:200 (-) Transcript_61642:650-1249(-)
MVGTARMRLLFSSKSKQHMPCGTGQPAKTAAEVTLRGIISTFQPISYSMWRFSRMSAFFLAFISPALFVFSNVYLATHSACKQPIPSFMPKRRSPRGRLHIAQRSKSSLSELSPSELSLLSSSCSSSARNSSSAFIAEADEVSSSSSQAKDWRLNDPGSCDDSRANSKRWQYKRKASSISAWHRTGVSSSSAAFSIVGA